MGAALSKMPVPTLGFMGVALVAVLWRIARTGFVSFVVSSVVFNVALLYVGYNVIFYSFTTPIGDPDPHKQLKKALEDQLMREANEKIKPAPEREIAGWFTMRTTFAERKEADPLFEDKREEAAEAEIKKKKNFALRTLDGYRQMAKNVSPAPRNHYLVRLKGKVLFVYRPPDGFKPTSEVPEKDDARFDCIGAVSIDQRSVSIEDQHGPYKGTEGRYFNKRNAIVLRPVKSFDGRKHGLGIMSKALKDMSPEEASDYESKSIYMFSKNNSLTEDMYFALLRASAKPPAYDDVFSRPHLKWLIDEVSTMTDPSGLGWFNAFAGRMFLGTNQTALVEQFIIDKINKKLALASHTIIRKIEATEANVGHIPPLFSNAMLKRTDMNGDIAFQAHMEYRQAPELPGSGICITIVADIGVTVVTLTVRVRTLSGDVEVKIKQAPTNRFWWAFVEPPKMDLKIEPIVGSRMINIGYVTSYIESKLRYGMAESIILPNMDDIPFFNTEGMSTRGGLFNEAAFFTRGEDQDLPVSRPSTPGSERPASLPPSQNDTAHPAPPPRSRTPPSPSKIARNLSNTSMQIFKRKGSPTPSEPGSPTEEKRLRDSNDFGARSVNSTCTNDSKASTNTAASADTADEQGKPLASAAALRETARRDREAVRSQTEILKNKPMGFKKFSNLVQRRPKNDNGYSKPSTYYVPGSDSNPPLRAYPTSSLFERLSAVAAGEHDTGRPASEPPAAEWTDTALHNSPPASPPPEEAALPTIQQPSARQMKVPSVPKRPGVAMSLSSTPAEPVISRPSRDIARPSRDIAPVSAGMYRRNSDPGPEDDDNFPLIVRDEDEIKPVPIEILRAQWNERDDAEHLRMMTDARTPDMPRHRPEDDIRPVPIEVLRASRGGW